MSCASCHFDGEQDGRTWLFTSGPRNTTSLRGVAETLPLHWSADRDEVQDFEVTVRTLQAGSGLITTGEPNPELGPANAGRSADLDALAAYVLSLQMKPSPFGGNVDRGRAIFNRTDVGCATCHPAPRYTDSTMNERPFVLHDVDTGSGSGERVGPAFDTPSLHGVWDTAPYLHDGSAPTLRDVIVTRNPRDRHGHTSQLSESEILDLIAFLRSL
jgi:mono/diheme cytochrome c family protein